MKITFTLDRESDEDIIGYLDSLSEKARESHIRQALRDHIAIERNKTPLKELFEKLDMLISELRAVRWEKVARQEYKATIPAELPESYHVFDDVIEQAEDVASNIDNIGE